MSEDMISTIVTGLLGLFVGSGGMWSYIKNQNGKIELLLEEQIKELKKEIVQLRKDQEDQEERHNEQLTTLRKATISLYQYSTEAFTIAQNNSPELSKESQKKLIEIKTKIELIFENSSI